MSDINSWLFPGAAMSANQLNWSLNNNSNQLNQMLQNQVAFNQAQPRLGEQAVYWSQRAANQLSAVPSLNPYGVWGETGGGATPYQTTSDVFETGAAPFSYGGPPLSAPYSGEGGSSMPSWSSSPSTSSYAPSSSYDPYSSLGSMFGGLAGGLGGTYQGPGTSAIDWGNLFKSAPSASSAFDSWNNAITPNASNAINWGNLFGGAKTDPYPTMPMPGGLGQPMTLPQQQPTDYGSMLGRGMGGLGGAQQPNTTDYAPAPMPKAPEYGGASFGGAAGGLGGADQGPNNAINWSKLFGGDWFSSPDTSTLTPATQMPGGLGVPITQQPEQPAYDYGSLFGHDTRQPETTSYIPQQQGSDRYSDAKYGTSTAPEPSAADLAGGASARLAEAMQKLNRQAPTSDDITATSDDTSAQERARLAGLLAEGSEKDVYPGEAGRAGMVNQGENPLYPTDTQSPFAGYTRETQDISPEQIAELQYRGDLPIPKARPAAADAPQIRQGLEGRRDALDALKRDMAERGLTMTSSYRGPEDKLSKAYPNSSHTKGLAFDTRAQTPQQADAAISQIKQMMGEKGLVLGTDYKILDEVRNPSAWATGPHIHTALTEQGMDKLQQSFGSPGRPPAEIPYPQGVPIPQERPAEAPPREAAPTVSEVPQQEGTSQRYSDELYGTSTGLEAPPPRPPATVNAPPAPSAAPVKHSGLELARANMDTPIEKIAMERGGQKAVDQINFMAMGKTPRQLSEQYGSMFMSRAEPLFHSLGITRQDFEQAAKMPPARQDLKMRFGGDFGTNPEFSGQLPSAGAFTPFEGFRQSPDFENRAQPSMTQNLLGYTPQEWAQPMPENVPTTPLGQALGLEDIRLGQEVDPFSGEAGRSGYLNPTAAREALAAAISTPSKFVPMPGVGEYGPEPVLNPLTDRPATTFEPGTYTKSYFEPSYGYGSPGKSLASQQADLQTERAPFAEQMDNNPAFKRKLMATVLDEMGTGATDAGYARVIESLANRAARSGATSLDLPTLLGGPDQSNYYQGFHSIHGATPTINEKYAYLDSHPEMVGRLDQVIKQVLVGGSNITNLATDNASNVPNRLMGDEAVQTGTLNDYYGPPIREYFYSKDNPQNLTKDQFDAINRSIWPGEDTIRNSRAWYGNLMPGGQWTAQPSDWAERYGDRFAPMPEYPRRR